MIFLGRVVVWAVELVHMVSVGGGTKKARGGVKVYGNIHILACKINEGFQEKG